MLHSTSSNIEPETQRGRWQRTGHSHLLHFRVRFLFIGDVFHLGPGSMGKGFKDLSSYPQYSHKSQEWWPTYVAPALEEGVETSLAEMVSSKFSERLTLTQNTRWGGTEDTGSRPYFSNPHTRVHTCTPICSYNAHTLPHTYAYQHTCVHTKHTCTAHMCIHMHTHKCTQIHRGKNIPLRNLVCCCLFFSVCVCMFSWEGTHVCAYASICVLMHVEAGGQPWEPLFSHDLPYLESGSLPDPKPISWV